MPSLSKSNLPETMAVDLNIAFSRGFETAGKDTWKPTVEVVPARGTAKIETFYGDKGRLRRFRGERQPQGFREYKNVLTLDTWEQTETISKDDLADIPDEARAGALRTKIGDFTNSVSSSLEAEYWEFLHNGTSITEAFGKNLFDFFHTYKDSTGKITGPTQSNMHLGGSQLDATTLQLDQQAFAELQTDTGKPWGGMLTHVAVKRGSINAKNARELSNSQFTVEASTVKGQMTENVFQGAFNIIEFDYGFGASEWLSMDLSSGQYKPVKVLSHVDNGINNPEFTVQTEGSHDDFWRRDWAYGVAMRFDLNPGYWQSVRLHGSSSYTFTPADSESQRVKYPNTF